MQYNNHVNRSQRPFTKLILLLHRQMRYIKNIIFIMYKYLTENQQKYDIYKVQCNNFYYKRIYYDNALSFMALAGLTGSIWSNTFLVRRY